MNFSESFFSEFNLPLTKKEFFELKNLNLLDFQNTLKQRNNEFLTKKGYNVKVQELSEKIRIVSGLIGAVTLLSWVIFFKSLVDESILLIILIPSIIVYVIATTRENHDYNNDKSTFDTIKNYYLTEYKRAQKANNYIEYLVLALKSNNNSSHLENLNLIKQQSINYSKYVKQNYSHPGFDKEHEKLGEFYKPIDCTCKFCSLFLIIMTNINDDGIFSHEDNIAVIDKLYGQLKGNFTHQKTVKQKEIKENLQMSFSIRDAIRTLPPRAKSLYLIWLLLNIFVWFVWGGGPKFGSDYFFPFTSIDLYYYDYKEAIIYIFSPIIIYLSIKLWKSNS